MHLDAKRHLHDGLPLNMLVAIRWYAFEWWSALILVLVLSCVPVVRFALAVVAADARPPNPSTS
jgi:ABC-type transport system involved in cytochrome bd biosynthesis fused ATPase/permease subunit